MPRTLTTAATGERRPLVLDKGEGMMFVGWLRSWWRPEQMRALLERADFRVASDENLISVAATYGAELAGTARFARSGRIVVADRAPS